MHIHPLTHRIVIALISTLLAISASAKDIVDYNWIEVSTPNFEIRSALSKRDTVELAKYLEMLRVVVPYLTNIRQLESRVPLRILAFRDVSDFNKLGIDFSVAGFSMATMRQNILVVREGIKNTHNETIMHEYTHFLIGNQGDYLYPRWFNEGFAEYLGSARLRGEFFEIGATSDYNRRVLENLDWVRMEEILNGDAYYSTRLRKNNFYAQSWALVHFLQNRKGRETSFTQDMAAYIRLVEEGATELSAFEDAFGVPANKINTTIQQYVGGPNLLHRETGASIPGFRVQIEPVLKDFQIETVKLTREDISLTLANLALLLGVYDLAENWYGIALGNESLRAYAEAGLGDVLKFQDQFDEALPHFERAVELAPDDLLCLLDYAEYWHSLALVVDDPGVRDAHLERARELYVKAWKVDDSMPEVFAKYAGTFIDQDREYDTAIEMLEHAQALAPASIDVKLMLAQAYLGGGRHEDARKIAKSVVAWSHSDSANARKAGQILDELDSSDN